MPELEGKGGVHQDTDRMIWELSDGWAETDFEISNFRDSRNTRQRQRSAEVGLELGVGGQASEKDFSRKGQLSPSRTTDIPQGLFVFHVYFPCE